MQFNVGSCAIQSDNPWSYSLIKAGAIGSAKYGISAFIAFIVRHHQPADNQLKIKRKQYCMTCPQVLKLIIDVNLRIQ